MKIQYIEVAGYKSLKEARVDLRSINILVGSNGSGKSNFLSFLEFVNSVYERRLHEYVAFRGGEDKMLHQGGKGTQSISAKIKFDTRAYLFEVIKTGMGFVFTKDGLWNDRDPDRNKSVDVSNGRREADIKLSNLPREDAVRGHLGNFRKYHFQETGGTSPINRLSHIQNDIYFLYDKGQNLGAFLFNIRQCDSSAYKVIVMTIQSIVPYFADFYFQPNAGGYTALQWHDKYSLAIYDVSDLSNGTLRFMAMTALLLQPDLPPVILIDEPELGLPPEAIVKLAGMIQSAAARDTQVIVATQSDNLINHFEAKDLITVNWSNGGSLFKRP
jgi:predicted ATPase